MPLHTLVRCAQAPCQVAQAHAHRCELFARSSCTHAPVTHSPFPLCPPLVALSLHASLYALTPALTEHPISSRRWSSVRPTPASTSSRSSQSTRVSLSIPPPPVHANMNQQGVYELIYPGQPLPQDRSVSFIIPNTPPEGMQRPHQAMPPVEFKPHSLPYGLSMDDILNSSLEYVASQLQEDNQELAVFNPKFPLRRIVVLIQVVVRI
ncbi:hypothetical protein C8Q78DRAFT_556560 [Trametes maxima]|nr:hypothetical protein C8Q78DRAFT_556560 [Trametes maxima]